MPVGARPLSVSFSISYLRKREWPCDPPGQGKILEIRLFTLETWISGQKPAKIDNGTCLGRVWSVQISILCTIEVSGAPFSQVIAQTPRKGLGLRHLLWKAIYVQDSTKSRKPPTQNISQGGKGSIMEPNFIPSLPFCTMSGTHCLPQRGSYLKTR